MVETAIMTKICPASMTGWDFHGKKVTICLFRDCPVANPRDCNKYECPVKNPEES